MTQKQKNLWENHNTQMAGYRWIANQMEQDKSKLTQAAQFDGEKNSMIAHYALSAVTQGYTYAEYVQFALAYSNTATLSELEYLALHRSDYLRAWRDAVNKGPLGKEMDKHMIEALIKGVSVIHVTTSETGDIVLKHLEASMLFNQRNHTE